MTPEDRALQLLRERDTRQRALLDAFPGYLLRINAELRHTCVNHRLAALSGRQPDDLIGRTVAEVAEVAEWPATTTSSTCRCSDRGKPWPARH